MSQVEKCEECGEVTEDERPMCRKCCEHGDFDDHCCLNCGKDMTEEWAAAAYDRAKNFRKYGEW